MCEIVCIRDDGGRAAAGFTPARAVDDCVTRAVAIATATPYRQVHAELGRLAGDPRLPDVGLAHEVSERYLEALGWAGTLNLIGDGWRATMRDLPPGRYVLVNRNEQGDGHLQAFITDGRRGELRDMDSRRGLWRIEDWVPHPFTGWWTKNPVRPRRPAVQRAHALSLESRRQSAGSRLRSPTPHGALFAVGAEAAACATARSLGSESVR